MCDHLMLAYVSQLLVNLYINCIRYLLTRPDHHTSVVVKGSLFVHMYCRYSQRLDFRQKFHCNDFRQGTCCSIAVSSRSTPHPSSDSALQVAITSFMWGLLVWCMGTSLVTNPEPSVDIGAI